jgi:hypothetical protein
MRHRDAILLEALEENPFPCFVFFPEVTISMGDMLLLKPS